ncbi:Meiotic expression up-regulated protein [Schizosaccharomyces pombe]
MKKENWQKIENVYLLGKKIDKAKRMANKGESNTNMLSTEENIVKAKAGSRKKPVDVSYAGLARHESHVDTDYHGQALNTNNQDSKNYQAGSFVKENELYESSQDCGHSRLAQILSEENQIKRLPQSDNTTTERIIENNPNYSNKPSKLKRALSGENSVFSIHQRNSLSPSSNLPRIPSDLYDIKQFLENLDARSFKSDMDLKRSQNMRRRATGYPAIAVPFLNGSLPQADLPPLRTIEDIDSLTREQCLTFIQGYGIPIDSSDTVYLKEKLRDAIGMRAFTDMSFEMNSFHLESPR